MSQLVACCYSGGLVLAADRRVVVERDGEQQIHSLRKVFGLGPSAAVATSGAAVGIMVSRSLSRLFRRRAAFPFQDLEDYVLAVFQKEYDAFVRQGKKWFEAHPEARRLSYVLLGGQREDRSHLFRFFASEAHGQEYRVLPTGGVLTAPRRLGLEARLLRCTSDGVEVDEVCELVVEGLRYVASKEDAVAGPYDVAVFDWGGMRIMRADP